MRVIGAIAAIVVAAGCRASADSASTRNAAADSTAHLAHSAYTSAINSNNLDSLMGMMTEDVVFLAAHSAPMVGKAAVRPWAEAYLRAYNTSWDKQSQEFVVAGEWAFERYSYKSTDTPRAGGAPVQDTGWGLVIYHRDPDGKWRVARDAFSTDQPLPTP